LWWSRPQTNGLRLGRVYHAPCKASRDVTVSATPTSETGRSTGRFHLDEKRPLVVMRCYFDGSQGADDNNSHFERLNGWDDSKISALVLDALNILQGFDKRRFCSFVCSIDLQARERLIAEGYVISEPGKICAELCIAKTFKWYFQNHKDELECAYIFFDQGEPFISSIRRIWAERHNPKSLVAADAWGLIRNVLPVDMRDVPPVQAADMLVWAHSRGLSRRERPYRHLKDIMHQIIPSWTFILDEHELRRCSPSRAG
jgi:Protein of unknown function (DUF3800)